MNPTDFESYDGLIFDCDGTLADSMPVHYVAWRETLLKHGIEFPEDTFYAMGGMPSARIVQVLSEQQGVQADSDAVAKQKEDHFHSLIETVQPLDSVVAVAESFRGQKPMAVASGSDLQAVNRQLTHLGIIDWFDALVTAEHTERHKPHPDVFLLAAERLGVQPDRCVVFEDSPLGFQAADAASMDWVDVRVR
ncbi:Fructose-1-phosphate phosphatase YqaB [Stieleria bergensis]|uniref:Fructose-1-phosphate phosphatase YqaB n=1 Tax=Stieleria bergensis TaxID=2528025 RepID=A0A517SQJ7_9BACT|nr:MAG: HAD family hydrolase [Rhodopirellula sp. TMED11]QDT58397.1 Fructose-1-phosphate phosphatase YqaB [Planctomycetes bacterium SV_7m_r]